MNRTGPKGEVNNGTRGKFNESQTEFRIKLHAKALATKHPTIKDMVQIYKEKFNIDITEQSEKMWRKSNIELINKRKLEMIENGDIEIVVIGPRALSETLQTQIARSCMTLEKMRKKLHETIDKVEDNHIEIEGLKLKQRKNENLERFIAFSEAMSKLSGSITKQIDTLANISGVARAMDKEKDEEEFKEESAKVAKEFDPSAPISDEERALLDE